MNENYIVRLETSAGTKYLADCTGKLADERSKAKRFLSEFYAERAAQKVNNLKFVMFIEKEEK